MSASYQSVKRLFVASFIVGDDANNEAGIKGIGKYFLSRGKVKNYNV